MPRDLLATPINSPRDLLASPRDLLATKPMFSPVTPEEAQAPMDPMFYNIGKAVSPIMEKSPELAAMTAGASNVATAIGTVPFKAGNFIAGLTGFISPKTKQQIDTYINKGSKPFETSPDEESTDVFNRSAAEQPLHYYGTQAGMAVPALAKSMPDTLAKASGIVGGLGRAGYNATLSAGLSDPENQNLAAGLGAGVSLGVDIIAKGVQSAGHYLTKQPRVERLIDKSYAKLDKFVTDTKQWLQGKTSAEINAGALSNRYQAAHNAEQKLYSQLKEIPLESKQLTEFPKFSKMIDTVITKGEKDILTSTQKTVLKNASTRLKSAKTMSDLLNVRYNLSTGFNKFDKGKSTDSTYALYSQIRNQVDDIISSNATKAGKGKIWEMGKKMHENVILPMREHKLNIINQGLKTDPTSPLKGLANETKSLNLSELKIGTGKTTSATALKNQLKFLPPKDREIAGHEIVKKTLYNLTDDPEHFNLLTADKDLTQYITRYKTALPKKSLTVLKGAHRIINQIQRLEKIANAPKLQGGGGYTARMTTAMGAGASLGAGIGGAEGYRRGGATGALLGTLGGGAIGAFGGYAGALKFNKFIRTEYGFKLLEGIGEGKPWASEIAQAIRMTPSAGLDTLSDEDTE